MWPFVIYLVYLAAVLSLSEEIFSEMGKRINTSKITCFWNNAALSSFILKSIVFFCAASFVLLRAKLFLQSISVHNEVYPLLLGIVSGLLITFAPVRSAYFALLFFIMVHIRFLYLVMHSVSRLSILMVWVFPSIALLYVGYVVVMSAYSSYGISFASFAAIAYISVILGLAKPISQEVAAISSLIRTTADSAAKWLLDMNDSITILALRFGISIGGSQNELKEVLSM